MRQFTYQFQDLGILSFVTTSMSQNERITFYLGGDALIENETLAGATFYVYEKTGSKSRASSDSNTMISAFDWDDVEKTITVEIDVAIAVATWGTGVTEKNYWLFARPTLVSGLRTPLIQSFFKVKKTVTT